MQNCFSYGNKIYTITDIVNKSDSSYSRTVFIELTVTSQGENMSKSNNLYRDILTGLFFTTGVFGFMSGEFIISTMLFGAATISSNLDFTGSFRA
ncbi:hypothetical protein A1356_11525 [Methylomonas koyamae]|uniref:Uncharacterized protein n=1 Tax=Methylomonas koyamae TaxID=702114 RepID=A0AA91I5F3_9GAMM|nr:hypothetical protein A1356_11525 [Methylomonas koyamae]